MSMHNQRINEFVNPNGNNFATGNEMKVTIRRSKKQMNEENAPSTMEILKIQGKDRPTPDTKTTRDNKSVYARHSGDQSI